MDTYVWYISQINGIVVCMICEIHIDLFQSMFVNFDDDEVDKSKKMAVWAFDGMPHMSQASTSPLNDLLCRVLIRGCLKQSHISLHSNRSKSTEIPLRNARAERYY